MKIIDWIGSLYLYALVVYFAYHVGKALAPSFDRFIDRLRGKR